MGDFVSQWYDYVFLPHLMNRLYLASDDVDIKAMAESVVSRTNDGVDAMGSHVYMKLSTMTAKVPLELSDWNHLKIEQFVYKHQIATLKIDADPNASLTLKFTNEPSSIRMRDQVLTWGRSSPVLRVESLTDHRWRFTFPYGFAGILALSFH